jgi:hypothetical protein
MNLTASLLDKIADPRQLAATFRTARLMKTVTPGETIHSASGSIHRVLGKSASVNGIRLRITHNGGERWITASQLAALRPLSPAIRRVAGLVHRILAFDNSLSSYVNAAIEQAGLPQDPSMNWGRWLTAKYGPVLRKFTKDEDLIDDAIREVVVHQLYELRLLDKHSPHAHFDENHPAIQGKDLAKKVSAFLTMLFTRNVSEAVHYVKKALGVGALGELGLVPTQSLYNTRDGEDEDDTFYDGEVLSTEYDRGVSTEDSKLADDEVDQFLDAFNFWLEKKGLRENTIKLMHFITKQVAEGANRSEIRDELVASKEFRGRDGQPYTNDTFKFAMLNWAKLIQEFASWEGNPLRGTDIADAIVNSARAYENKQKVIQQKRQVNKERRSVAAGLVLAQDDTGILPHQPYSNNTPTVTVVDQAPQSPNVSQQEESLAGKGNSEGKAQTQSQDTPPQISQQNQGEEDTQQPKRTITPEIPGMNHV